LRIYWAGSTGRTKQADRVVLDISTQGETDTTLAVRSGVGAGDGGRKVKNDPVRLLGSASTRGRAEWLAPAMNEAVSRLNRLASENTWRVRMLRRLLLVAVVMIGLVVAFLAGALAGALYGEYGTKLRRFDSEKELIVPVLASDPAFASVEVLMFTGDGAAELVASDLPADKEQGLRVEMLRLFGEFRITDMMRGVSASPAVTTPAQDEQRP